jgi:hypothetical protein
MFDCVLRNQFILCSTFPTIVGGVLIKEHNSYFTSSISSLSFSSDNSLPATLMAIIKPATPGFLTTLVATILLAVVSFSVPYFRSVYFLKASLAAEGQSGDITFGTLGYCVVLNSSTTCSNATVGYSLGRSFMHLVWQRGLW